MNIKILIDQHHEYLTESLFMLFEDRLGYEVYTPLGMDWYKEGFWAINNIEATAIQYLEAGSRPYPAYEPIKHRQSVTLEDFKKEKFDIILASIPAHVEPFIKLRDLYQPQAKLIFQVGNAWTFDTSFPIKNILASAKIPVLSGFNQVEYHQEFDTKVFNYEVPQDNRKVYSFINCLGVVDIYRRDWDLFLQLEKLLPDWEFKSFGGQCRDGSFSTPETVAAKMKEATLIFHCKTEGDGYGHALHQAAAVGRSLITRASDYKGKLAEILITPDSCILVDNKTPEEIAEQIQSWHYAMRGAYFYDKLRRYVNFDEEEKKVREFIDKLQ